MKKVAVIGAGVIGLTTAYYLKQAGYKVTVFDQEQYPAMKCSFANGGQISVSNSEVWNTSANIKRGLKWMFNKDAPLLIRPRFDWQQIKWLAKFLWHTAAHDYARNTARTIQMGIESRQLYKEIVSKEKIEFDQSDCGILHFYKNENYLYNAIQVKELYTANGCEWDIVSPATISRLEPTLDSTNFLGGAWTSTDWTGDIHKFCTELAKILNKKYGVKFFYDKKINNLQDLSKINNFDFVVVSCGVGSNAFARSIGDSLDVYPVKGYSITIELDEESAKYAPTVSLLDDEAKIVTSRLGNRFRVAGTAEFAGENYDIRRDRIQPLLKWVHTNFPKINTHNYSQWACLRPMTPNMMPIVRASKKNPHVFYNTGHGHLGWTLAPATAKKIVGIIGKNVN